jgi:hypothetical protein
MKKNETTYFPLTLYKIAQNKSDFIKLKIIVKNIRKYINRIVWAIYFLDRVPKAFMTNVKVDKWGYLQVRSFCKAKKIINHIKRQLNRMVENIGKLFIQQMDDVKTI